MDLVNDVMLTRILFHPLTLMIVFGGLLISGRGYGGFYGTYVFHAAGEGYLYGWLGIAGLAVLLVTAIAGRHGRRSVGRWGSTIGPILLLSSLALFFLGDGSGYNAGTFQQAVPLASFGLFGICWVGVVVRGWVR